MVSWENPTGEANVLLSCVREVTSAVCWRWWRAVCAGPAPGKAIPLSTRAGAPRSRNLPPRSDQMASPPLAFGPVLVFPCYVLVQLLFVDLFCFTLRYRYLSSTRPTPHALSTPLRRYRRAPSIKAISVVLQLQFDVRVSLLWRECTGNVRAPLCCSLSCFPIGRKTG